MSEKMKMTMGVGMAPGQDGTRQTIVLHPEQAQVRQAVP